jgi:hypothetical protein
VADKPNEQADKLVGAPSEIVLHQCMGAARINKNSN